MVTLRRKGEEQVAERTGSAWRLATPDGKVDEDAVKDLLLAAGDLRAVRYEADDPQDLAPYGLDKPSAVLSLGLKGEGSALGKTLLLGDSRGRDEHYAMLQGQDVVFTIADDAWRKLTNGLQISERPEEASSEPEPETTQTP